MDFDCVCEKYYRQILHYCQSILHDTKSAEDCTQEVFFALAKKMHLLRLDTNVAAWLYKAAQLEIKRYKSKKKDEISIDAAEVEIADNSMEKKDFFDDILTEDEYKLAVDFYVYKADIRKLSENLGISVSACYQRLHRIKAKILNSKDKLYNLIDNNL